MTHHEPTLADISARIGTYDTLGVLPFADNLTAADIAQVYSLLTGVTITPDMLPALDRICHDIAESRKSVGNTPAEQPDLLTQNLCIMNVHNAKLLSLLGKDAPELSSIA